MSEQSSEGETPAPVLQRSELAKQHLALLGREEFEFRCFRDKASLKLSAAPVRHVGALEKYKQDLRRLNASGYGIFVQVHESDGKGNRAENIISAKVFFADLDGAPRENISRLGMAPHLVLLTSPNKFHAYWRVDGIPLDQYKAVQQRLAKLLDSDPAVCDLPRVMRLAGFLHQKAADAPHLVEPIESSDGAPYAYEEFVAALSDAEEREGIKTEQRPAPAAASAGKSDIWRAREALQFLTVKKLLDMGSYDAWIRVGFALKASYGDQGWNLFHDLSIEAPGYESEASCRAQWDGIDENYKGKPLTIATFMAQAKEAGWKPTPDEGGGGSKRDQAVVVLEQAAAAGDEFWVDQNDRAYVSMTRATPSGDEIRAHHRIDSTFYRGELRARFFEDAVTKTLASEQENRAIGLMQHRARQRERHSTYLRVAGHEGAIYIDLGRADGKVVRVDREGTSIVTDPPIRFIRGSRGELPLPESGGLIADFERHLNLSPGDLKRALGWLIGTFNPDGPFMVLLVEGRPGTGKSNLGDKLASLTDPPLTRNGARFSLAADERDLHVHASHARVLFFDNISSFSAKDADRICCLSTGAASSNRMHHTMDEEFGFALVRPIIVTTIATPSARNDLLSRCLRISALDIEGGYKSERDIWDAFERDRPKLLGFLLDAVSQSLRNAEAVKEARREGRIQGNRMQDFALFVEGAAEALGMELGEFSALLNDEQVTMQAEAVVGDPVADGIARLLSQRRQQPLNVTSAELRALLAADDADADLPPTNKVRGHLSKINPGLQAMGIVVDAKKDGHAKVWKMLITAGPGFRADAIPNRPPPRPSQEDHF
jgi:hypothetical protein